MELMSREQVRRIPIVDERGDLVGVVAQADVVLHAEDDTRSRNHRGDLEAVRPARRPHRGESRSGAAGARAQLRARYLARVTDSTD
jgi:CBS domain containing-hemolysin-like protein